MKKKEMMGLEELKRMERLISEYDDIDALKVDIRGLIMRKEKEASKKLNVRFDLEMMIRLNVLDPWELNVVKSNHIANLQELIDCNLDQLVGITESIKQGLEWVRAFYDMSSMEENRKPKAK